MDPESGNDRIFNEQIEGAIDALVEKVHYSTGGAFGERGHSVILAECVKCGDLYGKVRHALATEILTSSH